MKLSILILLSLLTLTGCQPDTGEDVVNPNGVYLYDSNGDRAAIITVTFTNPSSWSDVHISLKNISGRVASFQFQLQITNTDAPTINYTSNNDVINLQPTSTFYNFINLPVNQYIRNPVVIIVSQNVMYTSNG